MQTDDNTLSDTVPLPVPVDQQQFVAPDDGRLKVGLFYADEDVHIANRIIEALSRNGCKTAKCDFHRGGLPKMEFVESFICQQRLVMWLATCASLNDKEIVQAARHIAQYASIGRKDLGIQFVTVQPREFLNAKLPLSLDAYTTLREDEHLEVRIQETIKGILRNAPAHTAAGNNSTATTNAVGDPGIRQFRNIPPEADNGTSRDPISDIGDDTNSREGLLTGNNISDEPASNAQMTNVLHIHGANSVIQIGSDSVLTLNRDVDASDVKTVSRRRTTEDDDNGNSDGTPV